MSSEATRHLWVLILAAGEGTRVAAFTRDETGTNVPKQYSGAFGPVTLLDLALRRARRLVPSSRIAVVVAEQHRRWWKPGLKHLPVENVIVQPENRGTAAGLLLPARRLFALDRHARLLVLPSDHFVRDEDRLSESLVGAVEAIHLDDSRLVLVGMPCDELDSEYGWIVSGPPDDALGAVLAFREKPDAATAQRLRRRGALINTLMFSATAATLLELFARTTSGLSGAFEGALGLATDPLPTSVRSLYTTLPSCDFSRAVLERATERLSVLKAKPCGWTDLGTPARLVSHRLARSAPSAASFPGSSLVFDGMAAHARNSPVHRKPVAGAERRRESREIGQHDGSKALP